MNRKQYESTTRYAIRMWLICVAMPCLAMCAIAIVASVAEAAVTYEPAAPHKCYAVTQVLGAKPVEVPCSTPTATQPDTSAPAPVVEPQTSEASTPTVQAPAPTRILPTPHPRDHRCFPASEWAPAPDTIRPCVRIVGNSPERGAVRFAVLDADGVVRYSGYVNTRFRLIIHVRIVRVAEDGSFTWKARSRDGRTVVASVGNLQD